MNYQTLTVFSNGFNPEASVICLNIDRLRDSEKNKGNRVRLVQWVTEGDD